MDHRGDVPSGHVPLRSDAPQDDPTRHKHYLDWLRVLAIVGVFLVHATEPFGVLDLQVRNEETSRVLTLLFTWILASWGIALFFLVSGGNAWTSLRRRSGRSYIGKRARRLIIPLVSGSVLFSVVTSWLISRSRGEYSGSLIRYPLTFVEERIIGANLVTPDGFADWSLHLWFLGLLFLLSALSVPIVNWLARPAGRSFSTWVAAVADVRLGLVVLAIPLAVAAAAVSHALPAGEQWREFAVAWMVFLLGAVLFSNERTMAAVRRDWAWFLVAGVLVLAVYLGAVWLDWHEAEGTLQYAATRVGLTFIAWCLPLSLLGFGMRYLDVPNRLITYAMGVIIPFYVIHYPIVVAIAYVVVRWDLNLYAKALVVAAGAFVVTVAIIELVVRRFAVTRLLFGMEG